MNALQVTERNAMYALQTALPSIEGEALDLMVTSPQGAAKLRELILSLAVTGKLVRQAVKDGFATALLKQIETQREYLVACGKAKRGNKPPSISNDEPPFSIPNSWAWARIGELGSVVGGGTPKSQDPCLWATDHEIPWLTPADLYALREKRIGRGRRDITAAGLAGSSAQLLPEGTVLFSSRAPIGYVAIAANALATNQGFKSCVPYLSELADYLYWFLKQAGKAIDAAASGTTFKEISGGKFAEVLVPLPPLAEQRRIVARVEELMNLCDELEAHGRLQDEQHARLVSTLFNALVASESPQELAENWQRVASHFDLLLDRPGAVNALEQTILQLAVRGLLVQQDPADEPTNELLARIDLTSGDKASRKKRGGDLARDGGDSKLAVLPRGWAWTTIESIAAVGTGTTPSRTNQAYFSPPLIPWVTSGETRQSFIAKTEQGVSPLALRETSLTVYPVGTLVIAMYGQGKTRGQISELQIEATTNQACAAIVPTTNNLGHRRYLKLFFEKIYDEIRELAAGGAQPNLNVGKIKATLVPLPPLEEQRRIVARVEELRGLCTDLRERLRQAQATQSNLADALVASAAA